MPININQIWKQVSLHCTTRKVIFCTCCSFANSHRKNDFASSNSTKRLMYEYVRAHKHIRKHLNRSFTILNTRSFSEYDLFPQIRVKKDGLHLRPQIINWHKCLGGPKTLYEKLSSNSPCRIKPKRKLFEDVISVLVSFGKDRCVKCGAFQTSKKLEFKFPSNKKMKNFAVI